jgi:hypothetical protein
VDADHNTLDDTIFFVNRFFGSLIILRFRIPSRDVGHEFCLNLYFEVFNFLKLIGVERCFLITLLVSVQGEMAKSWKEKEALLHLLASSNLTKVLEISFLSIREDFTGECLECSELGHKITRDLKMDRLHEF